MKTKILLLVFCAAFLIPCVAQESGVVIMPDGTERTHEELMLSEELMTTYLNNLSEEEAQSAQKEMFTGLQIVVSQMNAMKGAPVFGGAIIFGGVDYDEVSRRMTMVFHVMENINGELIRLEDYMNDPNVESSFKNLSSQFFNSMAPGYRSAFKWLNFIMILTFRGDVTNYEKSFEISL